MNVLNGLACLLVCQSAGEAASRLLALPLPGPVLGMLLLLGALRVERLRAPVAAAAEALLAHFSLLFVPVGLGVITHLDLLRQYGWQLMVVLLVSAWIGLAATALSLRFLLRRGAAAAD
ncbi:MAG: CidA/LrgA family protein [Pseudomonadota bacterium]|nr:CidA/LrgA family protein [Pseudomonadota bacterium]